MPKNNDKGGGGGGGDGQPSPSGWNFIDGNKRDNVLTGTVGKDWISGKDGNDTLYGGDDGDRLLGGNGNDVLYGEADDDQLHGGEGDDTLIGGSGDDTLQGGAGADRMDGGDGYDIAKFVEIGHGLTFYADTNPGNDTDYTTSDGDSIVRAEEIVGTNYDDTMNGGTGNDYFVGARGEDTLYGNGGADTLYGSLDDDEIHAGSGDGDADTLIFLHQVYDYDGDGTVDDILGDGHDVVYGFEVGTDKILFLSLFVNREESNDPVFDVVVSANDDGDAVITYAGDSSIILDGVAPGAVTAAMFEFEEVV